MGTDIWLYVEKRIDDRWVWADEKYPNPNFSLYGSAPEWERESIYTGSSYAVFSILADVRNEDDFGNQILRPFFEHKGFPSDASEEVRQWHREIVYGDRRFGSWLTLEELESVDWDNTWASRTYYFDSEQYVQHKEKGQWNFGNSYPPGKLILVSNEEMERLIQLGDVSPNIYTAMIQKPKSYREIAKEFIDAVFPTLRSLSDGDAASVRIVFWFG